MMARRRRVSCLSPSCSWSTVFAAVDVRHRATRGVAAAVADGAIAVRSVWEYLNKE